MYFGGVRGVCYIWGFFFFIVVFYVVVVFGRWVDRSGGKRFLGCGRSEWAGFWEGCVDVMFLMGLLWGF